jgi:hypothetical protein
VTPHPANQIGQPGRSADRGRREPGHWDIHCECLLNACPDQGTNLFTCSASSWLRGRRLRPCIAAQRPLTFVLLAVPPPNIGTSLVHGVSVLSSVDTFLFAFLPVCGVTRCATLTCVHKRHQDVSDCRPYAINGECEWQGHYADITATRLAPTRMTAECIPGPCTWLWPCACLSAWKLGVPSTLFCQQVHSPATRIRHLLPSRGYV